MTPAQSALYIEQRERGVALLVIDVPGKAVNTLGADFAERFSALLDRLEASDDTKAIVLVSGKGDSFIAGADIDLLASLHTAEQAADLCRAGQRVLGRLQSLSKPVVAAIHGACLGGGLEVALACRRRIASDDPKTKLGLPEVQLGILPGLGGTQRLPRLIGLEPALDLLLTGKQLDAKRALRAGLVDEVVPQSILLGVAVDCAERLAERPAARHSRLGRMAAGLRGGDVRGALMDNRLGRKLLFDTARKRLLRKTRGHYPAPERILDVVRFGLDRGLERGLEREAEAFGELLMTPQAEQLIQLFLATQELKKDSGVSEPATPKELRSVAVLGAGLMGSGVAYVTADVAKLPVRLRDKDAAAVAAGLRSVRGILDERLQRRRITRAERDLTLARITATTDTSGIGSAGIVIEAVFEDLELKRAVLREVEQIARADQIFASNTSSLPISEIAAASRHPDQVIGMHYFSPVHKMPLLEVVVTRQTAAWVTRTCVELGRKQGKTVIVVNDGVGFYTTRVLSPYLSEAAQLLAEGVAVDRVDRALIDWGFPVGPFALLDEIGIDVGTKVGKIVQAAFGERLEAPPGMDKLLLDQRLGRKNQRGFYLYAERGTKQKKQIDPSVYGVLGIEPSSDSSDAEIAERCALVLINEAAHCYGDGVVRSARDADIGAIFGLGFPPFRGGPLRFVDASGAAEVVRRLEHYQARFGNRFAPAPCLIEHARTGARFYGAPVAAHLEMRLSVG
jgi:3-hydroxyacyl-CoA dehydrogenase/enoyl-CoA hydratase/3-hydroxybutyryl-CoA epimerase